MPDAAIVTEGLSKDFGSGHGVFDLDLEVEPGEVFGFLGPNGAGKTTTTRILLDLIRPTAGRARILGHDCRADSVAVRRSVGYLAGDFHLHLGMTGRAHLRWLGQLRGGVPDERIDSLAERIGLDLDRRIKELSKGNRQKVGLVQAFMHDPPVLLLDEPTSGLDPIVQQEFRELVAEATGRGATVFLSSHLLDEVQRTADRVGIIRAGRLVTVQRVDALEAAARKRVVVRFAAPVGAEPFAAIDGVSDVVVHDGAVHLAVSGSMQALLAEIARHDPVDLVSEPAPLDELFLDYYEGDA